MNWVDICIFAILALNSLIGFNQGFIVSIFNLAGLIVSYFVATLYYPIITQVLLNNQAVYQKVRGFVDKRLYSVFEEKADIFGTTSLLEDLMLPKPLVDIISKSPKVDSYTSQVSKAAIDIMSEAITGILIDVISLIIAFIIARIVLIFIIRILNVFSKLPILSHFNKLLGLGFGFIKGIIIVFIIFAVVTPLISVSPNGTIAEGVFGSTVGYYLYDNNILLKYLKDLVL
ncbi:hypothetical protein DW1_2940 [Proteiniborus sp. DW1]|uniref:CvpA family protein n=1 Tax=Proteiniborus sp. DW1 TaxID=1889883 RepID=UPI00092DF781|nr:CvpA family protein [Proteiniborus sp. DW1]SCG84495.1 hypothetical protein DW1_2940 [Proteiniborus sp. DW1]